MEYRFSLSFLAFSIYSAPRSEGIGGGQRNREIKEKKTVLDTETSVNRGKEIKAADDGVFRENGEGGGEKKKKKRRKKRNEKNESKTRRSEASAPKERLTGARDFYRSRAC